MMLGWPRCVADVFVPIHCVWSASHCVDGLCRASPCCRPDLETRLRMIQDVAMAFRYLHSFNPPILHRNLKSTNIMVNSGLQVKVRLVCVGSAASHSTSHSTPLLSMASPRPAPRLAPPAPRPAPPPRFFPSLFRILTRRRTVGFQRF